MRELVNNILKITFVISTISFLFCQFCLIEKRLNNLIKMEDNAFSQHEQLDYFLKKEKRLSKIGTRVQMIFLIIISSCSMAIGLTSDDRITSFLFGCIGGITFDILLEFRK